MWVKWKGIGEGIGRGKVSKMRKACRVGGLSAGATWGVYVGIGGVVDNSWGGRKVRQKGGGEKKGRHSTGLGQQLQGVRLLPREQ